jgi:hypothetical protein
VSGNATLRRELDGASKIRFSQLYRDTLEELRHQFGHSISILPDGKGRIERFNCFAYGLGVWEHPIFIKSVDDASQPAIISSTIVHSMIDDGFLKTIAARKARRGDLVLYFHRAKVTHAAVIQKRGVYQSKWGLNEVHVHKLWEVPSDYGNVVRYYQVPEPEAVLRRLPASSIT